MKLLLPLSVFLFSAISAFACSCETYGQPRADAKEYYTKKFRGAIFVGTIKAFKHDPAAGLGGLTWSELSVEIDEYWLGVSKPLVTVLTDGPNSSCFQDWKTGTKSFFIATEHNGRLYRAICDLANWGGDYPSVKWADYTTEILGQSKRLSKPK